MSRKTTAAKYLELKEEVTKFLSFIENSLNEIEEHDSNDTLSEDRGEEILQEGFGMYTKLLVLVK